MANFKIAEAITGGNEGGFVNDPNDRGGMTLNGISRKMWPKWEGWPLLDKIIAAVGINPNRIDVEVKKNTILQSMISKFYKTEFWDCNNLDFVVSQEIANEMYDTGVNMGTGTAAKYLQQALNLCNRNEATYKDVEVDGKIGANGETMKALNIKANAKMILATLNMLQGERYLDIMRATKSQETYWPGWMKRVIVGGW